jgi:ankyrin repeat protein
MKSILLAVPAAVHRRFHLESTYTSLQGASPLHVCAEYNSVACARLLLDAGAPVDARADFGSEGLGGHTPVFHTVNSNGNYCRPMMELLVEAGTNLALRLKGLVWGGGFEWETVVFDVTPVSYAQCGLYRQFQRTEADIYSNIAYLYSHRYGTDAPIRNVPNQYLEKS